MAKEKPNQSHELPGTDFRPRVAETLESGSYKRAVSTPYRIQGLSDMERTIYRLEKEYDSALETQKAFQLLRSGEKAPDFDQVMKIFTPEMLVTAQSFQNPTLILSTKGRSFNDLVSAMDAHKTMPEQGDVHAGKIFNDDQAKRPLENWGAYIVDGPRKMSVIREFDDETLILRERLKRFAEYKEANKLSGMNRWKYAQLMMQALKDGKPIDSECTWTMLDEDPALSNIIVPNAHWDQNDNRISFLNQDCVVSFFWIFLGDQGGYNWFRRSVGGDVPNA